MSRRLVRRRKAESNFGVGQQGIRHLRLIHRADPHVDRRRVNTEILEDVHKHITRQILAGDDAYFLSPGLQIAGPAKLKSAFQKRQCMRKKPLPLRREHGSAPRTAAFPVEFDPQLRLQRDQTIANALLGNSERFSGRADLAGPGQLNKRGNLIGAEMRQNRHSRQNTSIKIMIARINNYSL